MSENKAAFPKWIIVVSLVTSVCGLAVLAAMETSIDYQQSWLTYVVVLVIYLPIQTVVEGVLSAFWESPKWFSKTIPIILISSFYGVIYFIK